MSDLIKLRGVTVEACHGVLPEEKTTPQPFLLDIDLEIDLGPAGGSDDLADSVSYAAVAHRATEVVAAPPVDLIETLAERVAQACLTQSGSVEAATVTVHKPRAPIGLPFADVAVTRRVERAARVVVALGANLTDPVGRLADAVRRVAALDGIDVVEVSPLVETDPVGGPAAQHVYLNAVLVASTRLAPGTLLAALQGIEQVHGRTRDVRWGPRTLDLDLISYADERQGGEVHRADAALTLPHPRAHERAFVLVPWLLADPVDRSARAWWAALRRVGADDAATRRGDGPITCDEAARYGVRPGPAWPAHLAEITLVTTW